MSRRESPRNQIVKEIPDERGSGRFIRETVETLDIVKGQLGESSNNVLIKRVLTIHNRIRTFHSQKDQDTPLWKG